MITGGLGILCMSVTRATGYVRDMRAHICTDERWSDGQVSNTLRLHMHGRATSSARANEKEGLNWYNNKGCNKGRRHNKNPAWAAKM